ncbi:MAG: translocation protein TolB [Cyclobacteriaceae bacterium]
MKRVLVSMALILGFAFSASAQYYYTEFGQNRIQYKKFDWYFYSTNNFEVYYYSGGHQYALQALDFLEEEFVELTDILGYAPYTKTKIFIYNSVQDIQQSNIGVGGDVFTIGGKTDFVKLQVELAHPGGALAFKQKMVEKLAEILINDMMFGGSLAEIFQNSYLLALPEWFIGGASRYLAYGWSEDMDDYVRDYLSRKKINRNLKLQGEDAALVGQSIWNFIAIKYGEGNISNILNLTRIIRNEENSIASTLGIDFKQLLKDWREYYQVQTEEIAKSYRVPEENEEVASYRNPNVHIGHTEMNSTGDKAAYTYHKNGKYEVIVADLTSGRQTRVMDGGYLINGQEIDYNLPLIDWQNDHTLGVLYFKRGYLYLATYDLATGERLQKPLTRFNQIESFSFNDNGKLAVISGDVDGKNDLFLVSMRRNALKRITDDHFDDLDPAFVPGSAAVVFSSNRVTDSVKVSDVKLKDIGNVYNLFIYNLDTTTNEFVRLTNTFSKDLKPIPKDRQTFYYLSDQKGLNNIYKYSLQDSTFIQVSNYQYNVRDYDISAGADDIAYVMLENGRERVFVDNQADLSTQTFTPQTARKRLEQARFVVSRLPKISVKAEQISEPIIVEDEFSEADSLLLPDAFFFSDTDSIADDGVEENLISEEDDDFIDIDNYEFEDEKKPEYRPESFFSNYRKFERKSRVLGPIGYEPRFSFSNLVTSAAVDPIRGFSFLLESEISDILENHRLTGGVLVTTDFTSGDIYAEYDYLKYWMDFRLRMDRKVYLFKGAETDQEPRQKYTLSKIELAAALPLSNTFRLEVAPIVAITNFENLQSDYVIGNPDAADYAPDKTVTFFGGKGAMILDNTIERGFNIYQGTKGKIEYTNYYSFQTPERNFSRIVADLRHYQKLHKEITLAGRLYYGRSMGNNPQNFMIGGMQNWIFQQQASQGTNDPLEILDSNEDATYLNYKDNSNILFTEFVTNLRGFDLNEAYGSNALVFNAELRVPLFRYFSRAPITSNFLRNFQLIGFYDFGSAWSGKSPIFNDVVITKTYKPSEDTGSASPFSAEIASFQNPWLAGYGWGLRTVFLGYYLKLDVAKPIQDYKVGSTRIYLTIGLDF